MDLPDLPPRGEVLDALKLAVAPAAGAAAGVYGGVALGMRLAGRDWRRLMPAVGAVAVVAGLVAGNFGRGAFPWVPDSKWWQWGWWAVLLGASVEVVARCVGPAVGHLLRAAAVGAVAATVVPADWQTELVWKPGEEAVGFRWAVPAFVLTTALVWAVVVEAGRWAPLTTTAAVLVVAWGAVVVLMHQAWLSGTDAAMFVLAALTGVAVVSGLTRSDGSGAAAAAVLPVAVLLVVGRGLILEPESPTAVPRGCSLLVGLAPFAVVLLPFFDRLLGRRLAIALQLTVVFALVAGAVGWAMTVAPLKFGGEEW
jgi:hypothetical protein